MMTLKNKIWIFSITFSMALAAQAATYTTAPIFTAGTGENSATIALDFDYNNYFLFTYRWDNTTTPSAWDALHALTQVDNGADNVTVEATDWGDWGMYVNDIAYPGGIKFNYEIDTTVGWVLYIGTDNQNWTAPWDGCSFVYLSNGDWNSWVWTNSDPKNNWTPRRGPGGVPVLGPQPVTVQGSVIADGYFGDNKTVGVKFEFQSVDGGGTITRYTLLNGDGTFSLDNVTEDNYTVTVKGSTWLQTVKNNVTVLGNPSNIGTFELKGADSNGDNAVTFEDFSILQNSYGQTGAAGANPLSAVADLAGGTGGCGPLGVVLLTCLGLAVHVLGLRRNE